LFDGLPALTLAMLTRGKRLRRWCNPSEIVAKCDSSRCCTGATEIVQKRALGKVAGAELDLSS
jgi:hypothetical protein